MYHQIFLEILSEIKSRFILDLVVISTLEVMDKNGLAKKQLYCIFVYSKAKQ